MSEGGFRFSARALSELHESRRVENLEKIGGIKGLAEGLRTDLSKGLSKEEANTNFQKRINVFGRNVLPEPPQTTLFELIFEGLQDKTLIMLMISAVISLILGIWENPEHGWIEGTAILVAVLVVVMVSSLNDYQKEKQFRKLNERKQNKQIKVIRGGEQCQCSIFDVNVGEVVVLEPGDIVCADGIFISGFDVKIDESALTGESDAVKKNEEKPFFISGCQMLEGTARMLVVAIGVNSESGKALAMLQKESEDTPLQEKLSTLADQIAQAGLTAAIFILVILIAKMLILAYLNNIPFTLHMLPLVVKYFITSVTIVVVAVPEGLPLAVTIALAYSMMKMLKDQNLVRHLDACETMGGATTICSDKTGTLTQNRMTVVKAWITGDRYDSVKQIKVSDSVKKYLGDNGCLNSSAYEFTSEKGTVDFVGNKTEAAILSFVRSFGVEYKKLREEIKAIKIYPFSSAKKSMSTLVKDGKTYRLLTKGASEIVLARCKNILGKNGESTPINDATRSELEKVILDFASDGLRTICLGYKDYTESEYNSINWDNEPEASFTFISILGIQDPVRDGVPEAVLDCQKAGIVVRMVTGDNLLTAKNIAKECNILTEDGVAIEGPNFRNLTVTQMDEIIPKLQVMARSSPTDKYLLVTRLKGLGEVVAVTGDGTNDAPALKEAHVGFAMGIAGTEVAKEASDIILMDDNFTSIVKAMLWGRNVYDSIRKFLTFQLTVNIVAVVLAFVGGVTNEHGESPLKPVQLLWVNLIMDTMAALALATDEPTHDLINRRPYGKDDNLITNRMWRHIIGQAIYQLTINFTLLYWSEPLLGIQKDTVLHSTLIFNCFVMCQVFNEINCRKISGGVNSFSGLITNHICLGVLLFTVIFQWLIVEFGGEFAGTTPLSKELWLVCVGLGAGSIPLNFLLHLIPLPPDQIRRRTVRRAPSPLVRQASQRGWKKLRDATTQIGFLNAIKQKQNSLSESIRRRRRFGTEGLF